MQKNRVKPSPVRTVGPRELKFLMGKHVEDFEPEMFFIDGKLSPLPSMEPKFEGSPDSCAFRLEPRLGTRSDIQATRGERAFVWLAVAVCVVAAVGKWVG